MSTVPGYSQRENGRRMRVVVGYLDMIIGGSGRSFGDLMALTDEERYFVSREGFERMLHGDPRVVRFYELLLEEIVHTPVVGGDGYLVDTLSAERVMHLYEVVAYMVGSESLSDDGDKLVVVWREDLPVGLREGFDVFMEMEASGEDSVSFELLQWLLLMLDLEIHDVDELGRRYFALAARKVGLGYL